MYSKTFHIPLKKSKSNNSFIYSIKNTIVNSNKYNNYMSSYNQSNRCTYSYSANQKSNFTSTLNSDSNEKHVYPLIKNISNNNQILLSNIDHLQRIKSITQSDEAKPTLNFDNSMSKFNITNLKLLRKKILKPEDIKDIKDINGFFIKRINDVNCKGKESLIYLTAEKGKNNTIYGNYNREVKKYNEGTCRLHLKNGSDNALNDKDVENQKKLIGKQSRSSILSYVDFMFNDHCSSKYIYSNDRRNLNTIYDNNNKNKINNSFLKYEEEKIFYKGNEYYLECIKNKLNNIQNNPNINKKYNYMEKGNKNFLYKNFNSNSNQGIQPENEIELYLNSARIDIDSSYKNIKNMQNNKKVSFYIPLNLYILFYLNNNDGLRYFLLSILSKINMNKISSFNFNTCNSNPQFNQINSNEYINNLLINIFYEQINKDGHIKTDNQKIKPCQKKTKFYDQIENELFKKPSFFQMNPVFTKKEKAINSFIKYKNLVSEDEKIYFYNKNFTLNFNLVNKNQNNDFNFYNVCVNQPELILKFNNKREIKYNIDKELLIFLFDNEFEDWDFYCIHYLLSFKNIRTMISSIYSKKNKGEFKGNYFRVLPKHKSSEGSLKNLKMNKDVIFSNINFNKHFQPNQKEKTIKLFSLLSSPSTSRSSFSNLSLSSFRSLKSLSFYYKPTPLSTYLVTFHNYRINIYYPKIDKFTIFYLDFSFSQMKILYICDLMNNLKNFIFKYLIFDFSKNNFSFDEGCFENLMDKSFTEIEDYFNNNKIKANDNNVVKIKCGLNNLNKTESKTKNLVLKNVEIEIIYPYIEIIHQEVDMGYNKKYFIKKVNKNIERKIIRKLCDYNYDEWIKIIINDKLREINWRLLNCDLKYIESINGERFKKDWEYEEEEEKGKVIRSDIPKKELENSIIINNNIKKIEGCNNDIENNNKQEIRNSLENNISIHLIGNKNNAEVNDEKMLPDNKGLIKEIIHKPLPLKEETYKLMRTKTSRSLLNGDLKSLKKMKRYISKRSTSVDEEENKN